MRQYAVRTMGELGPKLTLAPERYRPVPTSRGVPLDELVVEVRSRLKEFDGAVILDTTHVKEGVITLPSSGPETRTRGDKILLPLGSLMISRLRPYLRQVAVVSASLFSTRGAPVLACSTEFFVLAARNEGESLAFLVPFLLSTEVQARLAAGQEGGHRPRVPREALMALTVPDAEVRRRRKTSARVLDALAALYAARSLWRKTLG